MNSTPQVDLKCLAARGEGWIDEWWLLWLLLEARIREIVLDGPANDPLNSTVRPSFRSLLCDTTTAEDFISETLDKQRVRAMQGTLLSQEHLEMELDVVVRMLVAVSFVQNRAKTFAQRSSTAGVSGLNRAEGKVDRLDAGDESPFGASVAAKGTEVASDVPLMVQLDRGKPCLRLVLGSLEQLTSVEETAASHTLPLLRVEEPTTGIAQGVLETRLEGGLDELSRAHANSKHSLRCEEDRLVQEGIDHPGMERRAQEELSRRLTKVRARRILEPLEASQLQILFGLPTLNAAEKRNSKYRKAQESLFPELHEEFQGIGERAT